MGLILYLCWECEQMYQRMTDVLFFTHEVYLVGMKANGRSGIKVLQQLLFKGFSKTIKIFVLERTISMGSYKRKKVVVLNFEEERIRRLVLHYFVRLVWQWNQSHEF